MELKCASGSLILSLKSFIIVSKWFRKSMINSSAPNSSLHPHLTRQNQPFKMIFLRYFCSYHQNVGQYNCTPLLDSLLLRQTQEQPGMKGKNLAHYYPAS